MTTTVSVPDVMRLILFKTLTEDPKTEDPKVQEFLDEFKVEIEKEFFNKKGGGGSRSRRKANTQKRGRGKGKGKMTKTKRGGFKLNFGWSTKKDEHKDEHKDEYKDKFLTLCSRIAYFYKELTGNDVYSTDEKEGIVGGAPAGKIIKPVAGLIYSIIAMTLGCQMLNKKIKNFQIPLPKVLPTDKLDELSFLPDEAYAALDEYVQEHFIEDAIPAPADYGMPTPSPTPSQDPDAPNPDTPRDLVAMNGNEASPTNVVSVMKFGDFSLVVPRLNMAKEDGHIDVNLDYIGLWDLLWDPKNAGNQIILRAQLSILEFTGSEEDLLKSATLLFTDLLTHAAKKTWQPDFSFEGKTIMEAAYDGAVSLFKSANAGLSDAVATFQNDFDRVQLQFGANIQALKINLREQVQQTTRDIDAQVRYFWFNLSVFIWAITSIFAMAKSAATGGGKKPKTRKAARKNRRKRKVKYSGVRYRKRKA